VVQQEAEAGGTEYGSMTACNGATRGGGIGRQVAADGVAVSAAAAVTAAAAAAVAVAVAEAVRVADCHQRISGKSRLLCLCL
jgi:hypothetical protein